MALEVGSTFARLGARFDETGFDRFDRRVRQARTDARKPVEAHLGVKADTTGVDRYTKRVEQVEKHHESVVRGSGRVRGALGNIWVGGAGVAAAGVAITGLVKGVGAVTTAYEESRRVGLQTNAVLKSTAGAAGVTAKQVSNLANSLAYKTGIDDEAIQSGENLLLTFTNVRNEAGKGNDIFTQSTKVLTDMSAALGQDMSTSAIQLGKALNDPVRGITALQRVGVSFTQSERDQIKSLVAHGKTLDAQKIILRELTTEFGGSAAKVRSPLNVMKVALGNVAETLGKALYPFLTKAANAITTLATAFTSGKGPAAGFASTVKQIAGVIGDVVKWLVTAGKNLVDFMKHNQDVQQVVHQVGQTLQTLGRTVANVVGFIVRQLKAMAPDLENIGRFVVKVFRIITDAVQPVVRVLVVALGGAIKGIVTVIRGVVSVISGIVSGDWTKVWHGFKTIVSGAWDTIKAIVKAGVGVVVGIFHGLEKAFLTVGDAILGIIQKIVSVGSHLPFVGGKFKDLAGKIGDLRDSIKRYRDQLDGTDDSHRKAAGQVDKLAQRVDDARKAYKQANTELGKYKKGTDAYRQAAQRAHDKERDLKDALHDQRQATKDAIRPIVTLAGNVAGFGQVVADVSDAVGGNVNAVLGVLGAKTLHFTIKHPRKAGAELASSLGSVSGLLGFATGGIPNPGSGARDDHLLVDPSGRPVAALSGTEGILNTPQMMEVDRALAVARSVGVTRFGGLDELWGSGMRHYAAGGRLQLPDGFTPTHQTAGLPGYPAKDIFGTPGEIVLSPVGGTIARLSGRPPSAGAYEGQGGPFGWSIYLNGQNHRSYYMTHFGSRSVHVGQHVRRGQPIGTVGDYPGGTPDHIHEGIHGGLTAVFGGGQVAAPKLGRVTVNGPSGPLLTAARAGAARLTRAGQAYVDRRAAAITPSGGSPGGGSVGGGNAANRALARRMAAAPPYRWTGSEWTSLDNIWSRESGYDPTVHFGGGHGYVGTAYGIPQANPGSKMASAGADWLTNPATQIKWGLGYIRGRYGDPNNAWAHWQSASSYARGGLLGRLGRGLARFAGGGPLVARASHAGHKPHHKHHHRHAGGPSPAQQLIGYTFSMRDVPNFSREERRLTDYSTEIDHRENAYGQMDRFFGQTDEVFLVDHDDGSVTVDMAAVNHRLGELRQLTAARTAILKRTAVYRAYALKVIKRYRQAIKQLDHFLARTRGTKDPTIRARRGRWAEARRAFRGRVTELGGTVYDLGTNIGDDWLDLGDLRNETTTVSGTTGTPATTDTSGGDTGGDTGGTDTSDASTAQAVADQATARATALQQDLDALRSNFTAFTSAGDIGAGGPNAFAAGGASYTLGSGPVYAYGSPAGAAAAGAAVPPGAAAALASPAAVVVQVHSFVPPSGKQAQELGDTVVSALASRPYSPATSIRVG